MIRQPWKRDRRDYTRSAGQHGTHLCLQQDGIPISPFLHGIAKVFLNLLGFFCLLETVGWWKIGRLTWPLEILNQNEKKPSKMPKHSPGEVTILLWQGNMEHICVCNKMVSQYPLSSTALRRLFWSSLASFGLLENGGLVNQKLKPSLLRCGSIPQVRLL